MEIELVERTFQMDSQESKNTYICEFCSAPFTSKEEFLLHFTESSCKKQSICRIESLQDSQVVSANLKSEDQSSEQPVMYEERKDLDERREETNEISSFQQASDANTEPQILCTVDMILCEQGNKIFITPDTIRVAEQSENLQQILSICEMASSAGQEQVAMNVVSGSASHEVVITDQQEVMSAMVEMETTSNNEVRVSQNEVMNDGTSNETSHHNDNVDTQVQQVTIQLTSEDQGNTNDECNMTNQEIQQQEMQDIASIEELKYECDVCQRKFKKASGLERHKVVHTRDGSKNFTCDICGRVFTTLNRLLKHEEIHEKTREEEHMKKHEQQAEDTNDIPDENKETFICETCTKTFSYPCCLLEHERVHFKENLKKNKDKFSCAQCDKTFHAASHLARHEKSHDRKKESFVCETCGNSFPRQTTLLKHQATHTDVKPYVCNVCGRGFLQSSNLTTHLRTHSKAKPYPCRTCGKAFSHSSSRVIHERTHTGEKPYLCETCGKKFRQSGDLAKHQRSHTGEKPYQCAVCDKSFSVQSNLLAHLRIHVKKNSQTPVTVTMVIAEGSAEENIETSS